MAARRAITTGSDRTDRARAPATRGRAQPGRTLLAFAVAALVLAACGGNGGGDGSDGDRGRTGVADTGFAVSRVLTAVQSGPEGQLVELVDDSPRSLPEGDLVTTDPLGEALLEARLGGKACEVHLFQQSGLAKRACSRAEAAAGSAACLEEGSAVFNECSNLLVLTPSGAVRAEGTWLWVTYLPAEQWTVAVLSEGRAAVRPVMDMASQNLGPAAAMTAGQVWFSKPGDGSDTLDGLPSRAAYPLQQLPRVVAALGIEGWYERAGRQAGYDRVPFPELPAGSGGGTPTPERYTDFGAKPEELVWLVRPYTFRAEDPPCATLFWRLSSAQPVEWTSDTAGEIALDDSGEVTSDSRQVCPRETTMYTLLLRYPGGGEDERSVTITVTEVTPTAPPPTRSLLDDVRVRPDRLGGVLERFRVAATDTPPPIILR